MAKHVVRHVSVSTCSKGGLVMQRLFCLFIVLFLGGFVVACKDDDGGDKGKEESVCGDGVCDADEDHNSCPEDCDESTGGTCGDGVCDDDETIDSCPEDCDDGGDGGVCGDGVCDDDENADTCPEDCETSGGDTKTCIAVYDLSATMEIAGTPGGLGDATAADLPGQLALRYTESEENAEGPADGSPVEVLHWFVRNEIYVDLAKITTVVNAFTPTCNGVTDIEDKTNIPDFCAFDANADTAARASSVYDASCQAVVWDACDFPPEYSEDPSGGGYLPEHTAEGPGCLSNYRSQGNVNCEGGFMCGMGDLSEGDNIQDGVWGQPLEAFTLSADGTNVELARTRTPNGQPSSTYLSFTGERTSVSCE